MISCLARSISGRCCCRCFRRRQSTVASRDGSSSRSPPGLQNCLAWRGRSCVRSRRSGGARSTLHSSGFLAQRIMGMTARDSSQTLTLCGSCFGGAAADLRRRHRDYSSPARRRWPRGHHPGFSGVRIHHCLSTKHLNNFRNDWRSAELRNTQGAVPSRDVQETGTREVHNLGAVGAASQPVASWNLCT